MNATRKTPWSITLDPRFLIALFALLAALPAAAIAHQTPAKQESPILSGQEQQAVHHNFKFMATGKAGPTKGATAASVQVYESEDGTDVVQVREWYESASDARRGLDTLTKKASRVIKQGSEKDGKGHIVGKRLELDFSDSNKASPEMVIAWTDGATVVRLRSTSLPLLLDFESQNYPGNSETTQN